MMNVNEYMEYISDFFFSDTVELLDLVLDDDDVDPQYSAITTLNRFWVYLQYKKAMDTVYQCRNVSSLLDQIGYTKEDIALFREKVRKEHSIYAGDILNEEFF